MSETDNSLNARVEKILAKMLPYMPRIYTQASYIPTTEENERKFGLIYKFSYLPSDALLYFVPTQSSVNGINKLIIKIPSIDNPTGDEENVTYRDIAYDIVIETNNGATRAATEGDIIAYRMCIFRFAKTSTNTIVLTNSPSYNSLKISELAATNALFLNLPKVGENSLSAVKLATLADISNLQEQINRLDGKVIYGTKDPEEALAGLPNGTLYVQIEED